MYLICQICDILLFLECQTLDVGFDHLSLAFLGGLYDFGLLPRGGGYGYQNRGQGIYMTITTSVKVSITVILPIKTH